MLEHLLHIFILGMIFYTFKELYRVYMEMKPKGIYTFTKDPTSNEIRIKMIYVYFSVRE